MLWTEVGRSRRVVGRCRNERSGDDVEKDRNESGLQMCRDVKTLSVKSTKEDFESGESENGSIGSGAESSWELLKVLVCVKGPSAVISISIFSAVPSISQCLIFGEVLSDRELSE